MADFQLFLAVQDFCRGRPTWVHSTPSAIFFFIVRPKAVTPTRAELFHDMTKCCDTDFNFTFTFTFTFPSRTDLSSDFGSCAPRLHVTACVQLQLPIFGSCAPRLHVTVSVYSFQISALALRACMCQSVQAGKHACALLRSEVELNFFMT